MVMVMTLQVDDVTMSELIRLYDTICWLEKLKSSVCDKYDDAVRYFISKYKPFASPYVETDDDVIAEGIQVVRNALASRDASGWRMTSDDYAKSDDMDHYYVEEEV